MLKKQNSNTGIISLMLNNREYFMGLMNGKTDETLRQKPNGEFFMRGEVV